MITPRLEELKLKTVDPGIAFCFVPSEEDLKRAEEAVDKFIELM